MRVDAFFKFRMVSHATYALLVGISLSSLPVCAEDTFSAVMARMKPQGAVSIHYEEVRYLELMDQPWRGSGYLYALPPDLMIKEQWYPTREIMGTNGMQLYYYDVANDVRHSGELQPDDPIAAHINAFRALMNGNRELIDSLYRVEFLSKPHSWELILMSKNPQVAKTLAKIVISGLPEKPADKIFIIQTDGDRSELTLRPESSKAQLQSKIKMLFTEMRGEN